MSITSDAASANLPVVCQPIRSNIMPNPKFRNSSQTRHLLRTFTLVRMGLGIKDARSPVPMLIGADEGRNT